AGAVAVVESKDTHLNDDISPSAGDDGLDFRLFPLGHRELIKRLLQIIKKSFPLCRRYHEMLVGLLHRTARVLLRSTGGPADHFRDEVFEACRGNAMMGLVNFWVRI